MIIFALQVITRECATLHKDRSTFVKGPTHVFIVYLNIRLQSIMCFEKWNCNEKQGHIFASWSIQH